MADMALDDFVQKNHSWNGRGRGGWRGRGRGRINFHEDSGRSWGKQQQPAVRGGARPKGSAFSRIGPRNGGSTGINGAASIPTNDLRDKIATKVKANVIDLREKLAPKALPPQPPRTKSLPKMAQTAPRPRSSKDYRTPSHYAPTRLHVPPTSHSQPQGQSHVPAHPRPTAVRSTPQFRLPSEAEAKKITVTVPGLTKTTSEMYRREERLAATIMRQKESRQQSIMKSREHFIASSITSAFGGEKERPPPPPPPSLPPPRVYNKYRSPSPPPVYHHNNPYGMDYPEPRSMGSSARPKGVTTVTTMVISNLNTTVSKNDIFELCNAVGPVDTVAIAAPGVAEVTFRYKDDALEAFRKYNQRNLDGQAMICHLQSGVTSRARPPPSNYRMPHTDLYSGDAGYSHARPYYS